MICVRVCVIDTQCNRFYKLIQWSFVIIDGNHRIEKASRDGKKTINSYKIYAEELIPYFYTKEGYECFVKYWNSKLEES